QVTLAQGDRSQVVRTGPDGKFRFRAFDGGGTLTVKLPQGWISSEPLSKTIAPALHGDTIRNDFTVMARRVLRGRLMLAGERLAALVALAPDFRLTMVVPPREVPSGARAAALLQRYLTGPALVPRERLIFAVAEFARPGHLGLILTRLQEPR